MLRIVSIVVDDEKVWFDDLVKDLANWLDKELAVNADNVLYTLHLDHDDEHQCSNAGWWDKEK